MSQTAVPVCPMCRSREREFFVVKHGAAYFVCQGCSTTYSDPRPSDEELVARLNRYAGESRWNESVAEEEPKARLVSDYARPPRRLLDVGCGSGAFVAAARLAGYQSEGQDLSPSVAEAASRQFDVRVHAGPLESVTGAFDVVTLWDVLEHAVHPPEVLAACVRLLAPGGHLFVMSPNSRGFSARLLRGRWWIFGPNDHLVLFSPQALAGAFEDAGLDLLKLKCCQLTPPYSPQEAAGHEQAAKLFDTLQRAETVRKFLVWSGLGDRIFAVGRKRA